MRTMAVGPTCMLALVLVGCASSSDAVRVDYMTADVYKCDTAR